MAVSRVRRARGSSAIPKPVTMSGNGAVLVHARPDRIVLVHARPDKQHGPGASGLIQWDPTSRGS